MLKNNNNYRNNSFNNTRNSNYTRDRMFNTMMNQSSSTPYRNNPNQSLSSTSTNAFSQELAKVPLLQSTQTGMPYMLWRKKVQSAINAGGLRDFFLDQTSVASKKAQNESSKPDYFAIAASILTEIEQKNNSINRDSVKDLFYVHKWLPYWFCSENHFLPYLPNLNGNNRIPIPSAEEFDEVLDELPLFRKNLEHFKNMYHPYIDQPPRGQQIGEINAPPINIGQMQTRLLKFLRLMSEVNIIKRNDLEAEYLLQSAVPGGISDIGNYLSYKYPHIESHMRSKFSSQEKHHREKKSDLITKIQHSIQIFDKISIAVKATVQTAISDEEYPLALHILDRENLTKASNDLSQFEKTCNEHTWNKGISYDAAVSKGYEKWSDFARVKLVSIKRSQYPNDPSQWAILNNDEKAIEFNASMASDSDIIAAGHPVLLPEYQRRQYLISMIHSSNDKTIEDIVSNIETQVDPAQKTLSMIHARITAHLTSQSTSLKQQRTKRDLNFLASFHQDDDHDYSMFNEDNEISQGDYMLDDEYHSAFLANNNYHNRNSFNRSSSRNNYYEREGSSNYPNRNPFKSSDKRKRDSFKDDKYGDNHPKKSYSKPYVHKWCDHCASNPSIKIKNVAHTHNSNECEIVKKKDNPNNNQSIGSKTASNNNTLNNSKPSPAGSINFLNPNLQRQTEAFNRQGKLKANLIKKKGGGPYMGRYTLYGQYWK